jgi:hypothetical protein
MRDEYDDRIYQALRHDFAGNLRAIANAVGHAFDRLHERLYGAPWNARNPQCKANRLTTR